MDTIPQLPELLPERISRLADLASDLWWASSAEARALFRMVSPRLWRHTEHNPVRILRQISKERLRILAADPVFLEIYDRVLLGYDFDMNRPDTIVATYHPEFTHKTIAYFSAEYGLHSSLPIYSGGLGVLAGDHVKTAGDMGLPIIAVGFLYPYGYFEQHIDADGKQLSEYRHLNFINTPLEQVRLADGSPLLISLRLAHDEEADLYLQVWRVKVGRVTIFLMDSDLEINTTNDREITRRLYGGDKINRLRQEMALGIGGVRALEALGIKPDVWHANEGHAAFLFVERLRMEVMRGVPLAVAIAKIRSSSIFTTHTPVPAGHDAFMQETITEYFVHTIKELGISKEEFLALGKHTEEWGEAFNMTSLAMNMTGQRNAVSKKHGEVTREMWPQYGEIGSVTNGVHIPTWLSQEWAELFTAMLSHDWKRRLTDAPLWQKMHDIPDEVFWSVRQKLNENLQRQISSVLRREHPYNSDNELIIRGALFDPNALTIGFARRFATYKRGALLFRDPDRFAHILSNINEPVQFIFSGKAHPADSGGQELIHTIWEYANDPKFRGKIFFLENYSMHSAKFLVQGVDMWLNTPRVPLEASGTSGMKAAINGAPNLSILDGWWCEGYNGRNGWAVNSPADATPEEQDAHDASALYDLLEKEIIPLYYNRDLNNIPRGWVKVAKESMASLIPQFTSERMLGEYIEKYYKKALG